MDRGLFENDVRYELCVPPLGIDFLKMNTTDAKDNFEWFISVLPERIDYLTTRCANDLVIPISTFDFSPESLIPLWRWFIRTAYVAETSKEELEVMHKYFSHLGQTFINKERLSVATEFILRDVGMYLGETFVKNFTNIKWNYYVKPKKDFFVNRPLLTGFVDSRYVPPFHAVFEPIHMAGVQASKLLNHSADELDLYKLFNKWLPFAKE